MDRQASSAWQDIFSTSNIESYGWACIRVYERLVDLEGSGFTTLVNPSRGATPFLQNLYAIHQQYSLQRSEESNILHGLNIPFLNRQITLPFTADPPDQEGVSTASFQIRDYWVRVLKAFLAGNLTSPELQFYQHVTLSLLGFEESLGAPCHQPCEKFVFVDTVISGRAVCEIERSFGIHGLSDFHLLLILDKNGESITRDARKRLGELEASGKATLIMVNELFTEDQGPALTGTWCLSIPQLVTGASNVLGQDPSSLVGAAASFVRVSADYRLENSRMTDSYGKLMVMLQCLLYHGELFKNGGGVSEFFRRELIESISCSSIGNLSPLNKRVTEAIAKNSIRKGVPIATGRKPLSEKITRIEVSSSHVIRVYFEDALIARLLSGFKELRSKPAYWYAHYNVIT